MVLHKRVIAPRLVQPPSSASRAVFILLVLAIFAATIFGAFSFGRQVGIGMSKPLIQTTKSECDALSAQLKQQSTVLEQSQRIDRETDRSLSKQIKEAQDEQLALEKEVSFLRRLIQEGGKGILQPKDFKVEETDEPGVFRYNFTVRQLIQDFGRSTGRVEIQVIGRRNGKETVLSLGKLEGSEPLSHRMGFKHFQVFKGLIKIPDDFEPEKLVVAVKPNPPKLIAVSETFLWRY